MNVLGKEVEVLNDVRRIIIALNEIHDLKSRTDDINEKLELARREKGFVLEYASKIEILHSIVLELFKRRRTNKLDSEATALMQAFVGIENDLKKYANVLQKETETNTLNITGEKRSLMKLEKALNYDSNENNALLNKLDELGGVKEINAHRRLEKTLNLLKEEANFTLGSMARICVGVSLFGAVACGDENIVDAPRPITEPVNLNILE